ncbi:MAG TPA: sensor histidine kinase, partial [Arenibaculum sp.]|nr:sensor histidine kinase [Arenibaculum sp.]
AQTLSLIFHELATNAARHGALSVAGGAVSVDWRIEDGRVRLDWVESGRPGIGTPPAKGLGLTLVEHGIVHGLGGHARIEFRPAGLACRLDFPVPDAAA